MYARKIMIFHPSHFSASSRRTSQENRKS